LGILDYLEKRTLKNAKARIESVSIKSAKTMLTSAISSALAKNNHSSEFLCQGALDGRMRWEVGHDLRLYYNGDETTFFIKNSTSLAELIEFVVYIEWINDRFIYNMPNPEELIQHGAQTARAVAEKGDPTKK
jgi:hypothetical protein